MTYIYFDGGDHLMSEHEHHEEQGDEAREHQRGVSRDRAYARRLDEKEIRERAMQVFDRFIRMGFTTHLIAVQVRGAVEYRIALYPDGIRTVAADDLAEIAQEFNFDYQMEQDPAYDNGWIILMYPLS